MRPPDSLVMLLRSTGERPPEAPLKVCPDFRGFEAPKIALSLSGDGGFEASGGLKAVQV